MDRGINPRTNEIQPSRLIFPADWTSNNEPR
jgi:hypothetical protein